MFGQMGAMLSAPEIARIQTASPFETLIDVSNDPAHGLTSDGRAKGLWIDGPLLPYRSGGSVFFLTGAMDTYRYIVPSNIWTAANVSRNPSGPVRVSANNLVYQDFDHRIWPFGVWADGFNLWAMGHHEWYGDTVTSDGIPGYMRVFGRDWVSTGIWMKSTLSGGLGSWSTKPYTSYATSHVVNRHRIFLLPESWYIRQPETYYGFQKGTNIVYENGWYYNFFPMTNLLPGDTRVRQGFCMIRWSDLEDPGTTQVYTASGWADKSDVTFQGNVSGQQPYPFFEVYDIDPYQAGNPTNFQMAQSVRYHWPTQQWLLFGYRNPGLPYVGFLRSKTLANPKWEHNGFQTLQLTGGGTGSDYFSEAYMTVFDPAASDQNFVEIGNNPLMIVADSHVRYKKQTLQISVIG
jgi:hypothetical protein